MVSCKHYRFLVSRNLDGDLNKKEKHELSDHFFSCPGCREVEYQFSGIKKFLKISEKDAARYDLDLLKYKNEYSPFKLGLGLTAIFITVFLTLLFMLSIHPVKSAGDENSYGGENRNNFFFRHPDYFKKQPAIFQLNTLCPPHISAYQNQTNQLAINYFAP